MQELSEILEADISVEKIDYQFFNSLEISGLDVYDQQNRPMLSAENVQVNFDFFKIFDGQFLIHKVALDSVDVRLRTDSTGVLNMQFLLDKLPKSKRPFEGLVSAPSICLKRSQLSYSKQDALGRWKTTSVRNINGELALDEFTRDSLSVAIKDLTMETKGLGVRKLTARLDANRSAATFSNMLLELPNSALEFDNFTVRYGSLSNLKHPENLHFDLRTKRMQLGLADLAPFVPVLRNNRNVLSGDLHLVGTLGDLRSEHMHLSYNGKQLFTGSLHLKGLPHVQQAYVDANIDKAQISLHTLQDIIANFQSKPFLMPEQLSALTDLSYQGHLSGRLNDFDMKGLLSTNIGTLAADARVITSPDFHDIHYIGRMELTHFLLGRLLNRPDMGALSLRAEADVHKDAANHVSGTIDGYLDEFVFRNYSYHGVQVQGAFTERSFEGLLQSRSRELDFDFKGRADFSGEVPNYDFTSQVNHLRLYDTHLLQKPAGFDVSGDLIIKGSGNKLDNLNGDIEVRNLRLQLGNKSVSQSVVKVHSVANEQHTDLTISSDLLDADFVGHYNYTTLYSTALHAIHRSMPSLIPERLWTPVAHTQSNNQMNFSLKVHHTPTFCTLLGIPVINKSSLQLSGHLSDGYDALGLSLSLPELFVTDKLKFRNASLIVNEIGDNLMVDASLLYGRESSPVALSLDVNAANDLARTQLSWHAARKADYSGSIIGNISAKSIYGNPEVDVDLLPCHVILADSLWQLRRSHIRYNADKSLDIKDFKFYSNTQALSIDGRASKNQSDSLLIGLKNVDLSYWLRHVRLANISFGGNITGHAAIYSAFQHPAFNAQLTLANGSINGNELGDIDAMAQWSPSRQMVDVTGRLRDGDRTVADVTGIVATDRDSIDFHINCSQVDLSFLNQYLNPMTLNLEGTATGHIHLYRYHSIGALRIVGAAMPDNTSLGIDILGTRYFVQDSVRLEEKRIVFDHVHVVDAEGNKGVVNGTLNHNGTFRNWNYHLDIDVDNIIALNTTVENNDFYYGKIYGTGRVHITGDESQTDITVKATTGPKSVFNISMMSVAVEQDGNFVRFVDHRAPTPAVKKPTLSEITKSSSKLNISLSIEATPDALLRIVVDPKTNDLLACRGNGNLRLNYPGGGDVKLYGNYTLENGSYSFTFQDVIHREFKIDRGSTINWTGDPLVADIDIYARYNTTASLSDLDEAIAAQTSRKSVPVSCILHLTDHLTMPTIDFDIDLPNTEEGIKQQVKNLISTEELRNRQVLYLLILNKFYKPDYMSTTGSNISQNDAYSLLTSTVTGQINNWISRLSNNFTVGVNIRTDGQGATASQEYATEFMYQPNPRLVINGNFGYRNDVTASNKVIADADVEYMLTKSGQLRAKAYTHTVDKYENVSKQGTTKQGVGLIYRKDFNSLGDLFRRTYKKVKDPGQAEKKKQTKK